MGVKINLDSRRINRANSKITIRRNYPEVRYINIVMKELSVIYVRLINQYKFKYQTVFSARFDKQDEDNQVLDETEVFNNLNINHNLTQSDLDIIGVKSQLEFQIQQQEMKDSGWRFDILYSMIIKFFLKLVK